MSGMDIVDILINPVGFSPASKLEDFINKKFSKLVKYHDGILRIMVTLKLEKDDKLENKVTEVQVEIKGQDIFAKKNARTFEETVDELYDVLKRQLQKVKEKRES
jgi:ribosomal subunit interface protein